MPRSPESTSRRKAERRQQILDAAVRVFARDGFRESRVQDVAAEAGAAYGLVYHYFGTKERLLSAVFDTWWIRFADDMEAIAAAESSCAQRVRRMADYVFAAHRRHADVVRLVVVEFGRSARLGETLQHPVVGRVTRAVHGVYAEARERGELLPGLSSVGLSVLFAGALEATLATQLIADIDGGDEAFARAQETFTRVFTSVVFHAKPTT